jgi:HPt (histidine-containing phosphotransfer) domain-containing protein
MTVTMTYNHINLEYLDTMTGGDDEMRNEMLSMLIIEIPDEMGKMQDATAASDWEEVFQISHKFKTTLSFIGNEEMITTNKTVEYCSRHRVDVTEIPAMVAQLAERMPLVLEELKQI